MSKRIILSFDGTWNTPDHKDKYQNDSQLDPTNVYKFHQAILDQDPDGKVQKKYYDTGVGTQWYDKVSGGYFGFGLFENIRQGYEKLVDWYQAGDEIFLIGFSRGAYTARSLVGLIRNAGLLKPEHRDKIEQAYKLYCQRDEGPDTEEAKIFRRNYSLSEVRIKFMGVWDTVGALGIPIKLLEKFSSVKNFVEHFNQEHFGFHDTKLSSIVEHAYHALAIDEHRQPYEATLWSNTEYSPHQVVEQRWFIGAHANVGGGYRDTQLSDISLKWMQDRAATVGLAFDEKQRITSTEGYYQGQLRDSYYEFKQSLVGSLISDTLLGERYFRKLKVDKWQVIDETVRQRLKDNKFGYSPKNLIEVL